MSKPNKLWMVNVVKLNTIKELEEGAVGKYKQKTIMLNCLRNEVEDTIILEDDYKIEKIIDYEQLSQEIRLRNMKWIMEVGR